MRKLVACLVALLATAVTANAEIIDYTAKWSGAEFGNSATAVGTITVDTSLVSNPGFNDFAITNAVITISGASSGNGTFTFADFSFFAFNWNTALDLHSEFVGQPQDFGGPWGTHEGQPGFDFAHDFNLFGNGGAAPVGTFYYQLTTNGGFGDSMYLTSFAPAATATPEPTSLLVFGGLAAGGGLIARRRMKKAVA